MTKLKLARCLLGATAISMVVMPPVLAQERDEEIIIVTATKRAENLQDVPIAISAFGAEKLADLKLEDGADLQLSVPNMQFGKSNFTSGQVSIRGVGYNAVGAASDHGVGLHLNDTPVFSGTYFETEFFDMERLEVLRGPQGTLYGRNATGGVINLVTAKATDEFEANVEVGYASYNSITAKGMLNIPLGESAGLRFAGFTTKRDGYTENTYTGNDIDDRNLSSLRATLSVDLSDKLHADLIWQYFTEDDHRTRGQKQLCTADNSPFPFNQGCVPYRQSVDATSPTGYSYGANPVGIQPGFDAANSATTLGSLVGFSAGLYAVPTNTAATSIVPSDLRQVHSIIDPKLDAEENIFTARFEYDMDNGLTLVSNTGYQARKWVQSSDFGAYVHTAPFDTTVSSPTDLSAFIAGTGGVLDLGLVGYSGIYNTRIPPHNSLVVTDLSQTDAEGLSSELRLQSDWDGKFNFSVGGIYINQDSLTDYLVFLNTGALLASPLLGAAALPTERTHFFSRQNVQLKSANLFGEAYYDVTDNLKFTLGLRYTDDEKTVETYANNLLTSTADIPASVVNGSTIFDASTYGVSLGGGSTTDQAVAAAIAAGTQVAEFKETTGRVGFDWDVELPGMKDTLLYAFYSRGYKGGGLNPPQTPGSPVSATFDPEFVNAYEVGIKTTTPGGNANINLTGFYYDYEGYQISKIFNQTSINENVDAKIQGAELEVYARPWDGFSVDLAVGYLNSEIGDFSTFDPFNPTAGDPNYIVATDLAGGRASNCIIPAASLNPADASSPFNPAAGATLNAVAAGMQAAGQFCTTDNDGDGVPNDASPVDNPFGSTPGIEQNLEGNALPQTPEFTVSLGAQYSWDVSSDWEATLRGDYYYQTESFSRLFNIEADRIDAWDQANVTLKLLNENRGIRAELYVKNLMDEDHINGHYLADQSVGSYQNIFILEPRIYGVTFGKSF